MFDSMLSKGLRPVLHCMFVVALAFASGHAAHAQPLIAAAHSDTNTNTLIMDGTGFATTPVVTLGTYVAPLVLVSATATHIVAQLPPAIPAGGYLLTVRNPAPADRSGPAPGADEFWVTIGATGVAGPPGPPGPQGIQGPAGAGAAPLLTKNLTLGAPGFVSLASWAVSATDAVGGYIDWTLYADDGGSQKVTETGRIIFNATANAITCTVQPTQTLHLGTVNGGCTPGFFSPGSQPGVSIFDNVSFSSPAPIVNHRVYFEVHTIGTAAMRLE